MAGNIELQRIEAAYARRRPGNAYSWFNPGQVVRLHQVERRLLHALNRNRINSLEGKTILEIGCGTGFWLREFIRWGASPVNVTGIDIMPKRIALAKRLCPSGVKLLARSAEKLPFSGNKFDIVAQFTAFTSIIDTDLKRRIAGEMLRVLKTGGLIIWYDFFVGNPRNHDVKGVGMREIKSLFPNCTISLRRTTLAPPLLRRIAPWSPALAQALSQLPFLCTHNLGIIRKCG